MNTQPLVSIITVNYNGAKVTCDLLESLKKITYPSIEVIVVDNASKENPEVIKETHPWVTLIRSYENTGFAGGNNLGFREAKGKYFMMLNNDTEVDPGFLEPLVEKLENDPTAGIAGSKIIFYGTDNIIQYAGGKEINPLTGRGSMIGTNEKDRQQYKTRTTSYTHGAAMMVKREAMEKTGMMAELYFLYYEELDFCERIKQAGYKIWFINDSIIYHKESMSVGKESTLKTYYMTRNRILFMRRNNGGLRLAIFMIYFSLIAIPKNSLTYIMKKRMDLLKAFLRGYAWNMVNFNIAENPSITEMPIDYKQAS